MKCITRKIILSSLLIFFFSACKEDVKKTMQTPNKRMNLFKGLKNISSVKLPKDKGEGVIYKSKLKDKASKNNIYLQATHSYFDEFTLDIAEDLFRHNSADQLFINTISRKSENSAYDFSKRKNSSLKISTLEYINLNPTGIIVQLHGFSRKKRNSKIGQKAGFIISSCRDKSSTYTINLANCLKKQDKFNVYLYPEEVNELGGVKNILYKELANKINDRFVHIEMSREVRLELKNDKAMFEIFNKCFHEALIGGNSSAE